jgi:signal transduction histidine kinase
VPADPTPTDSVTLDVLQANIALLAEKERLERERARLLELDRLRTEFLARVSHDLRTPLNSIIGFTDLLKAGDGGRMPRRSLDYLDAIGRNGHALLGLINDLLDLSGMELGRMSVRREPTELTDFLADIRAATSPILDAAGLLVTWPDVGPLIGQRVAIDRRRLLQVMTNLLDNARKFTPRGGRIVVGLALSHRRLELRVADTGPGIPESLRSELFRPFVPASRAGPRSDSTGLGLAIVKAIVDLHGGSLSLDRGPEAVGGCTFIIQIPQDIP